MSQVRVVRLTENGDPHPLEIFEGELVDESGAPIEAPVMGSPIFLYIRTSRRKKKVPWNFRTAPIVQVSLFDPGHWEIITSDGQNYSVDPDRIYH